MKLTRLILMILVGLVAAPLMGATQTPDPLTTVKEPVEEVLKVLKDPQYAEGRNREDQQKKIRAIATEAFDFVEISKRALARGWKQFTPDERRRFTDRFTELLLNSYTRQIQSEYSDEEVAFQDQQMVSENKASVKSVITREGVETPVNYSLIQRKDRWRIYDIQIEGVSLVGNYRTQFRKILAKETPDQLIARIEEKIAANEDQITTQE
ncbi:MAG: ABC transporter substrate-binding protein [Desulfobacterales bacterium]